MCASIQELQRGHEWQQVYGIFPRRETSGFPGNTPRAMCKRGETEKPERQAGSGNLFIPREELLHQQNTQKTWIPPKPIKKLSLSVQSHVLLTVQRMLTANQSMLITLSSVSLNHCLLVSRKGTLHWRVEKNGWQGHNTLVTLIVRY